MLCFVPQGKYKFSSFRCFSFTLFFSSFCGIHYFIWSLVLYLAWAVSGRNYWHVLLQRKELHFTQGENLICKEQLKSCYINYEDQQQLQSKFNVETKQSKKKNHKNSWQNDDTLWVNQIGLSLKYFVWFDSLSKEDKFP